MGSSCVKGSWSLIWLFAKKLDIRLQINRVKVTRPSWWSNPTCQTTQCCRERLCPAATRGCPQPRPGRGRSVATQTKDDMLCRVCWSDLIMLMLIIFAIKKIIWNICSLLRGRCHKWQDQTKHLGQLDSQDAKAQIASLDQYLLRHEIQYNTLGRSLGQDLWSDIQGR